MPSERRHTPTRRPKQWTAPEKIIQNAGGGQLIAHNKDGKISNPNTIAPGNDPNPPRDTKH